jgi:beta-xylosidase
MVWTSGWYQYGFGYASSPDLTHWSQQQFVEVMKNEPKAANTWAPVLFYDDQKQQWMVFWASTIPGRYPQTDPPTGQGDRMDLSGTSVGLNHRIYYTTTKDFKTWADAKLLYDPGFNCIDATIAKLPDGKYLMVLKDETKVPVAKKNLRMALADSPEGPWGKASDPISKGNAWVEGPTINRVNDQWYVYYDAYMNRTYGAIKTTDFKNWDLVEGSFSVPEGSRHGTVFPTTQAVIDRLVKENPG